MQVVDRLKPIPSASDEAVGTPENGIKGLRHWRQDLVAGLIVSLVSVPLSLGIAVASGAPPIAGIVSSIIAGLVFPFLGGANVTISGPAAGLAPVVFASICTLGHGNMDVGYPLVLAVISLAGLAQIILSKMKAAGLSCMFPSSAVEGLLCAIGLLIIAKQIPNFIGHPYKAHEFFGIIAETPSDLLLLNRDVFLVSAVSLLLLFALSNVKTKAMKIVPPQLIVVFIGIGLGQLFHLDPKLLIHIPSDFMKHGIVMPDFLGLFQNSTLWVSAIGCVITLALVDGCESLATIMAVDKIDPFHRKSNPDRTLFAMGVSNICSSLAGGLTIIPGGIKSTTCVVSGGRTLWANFYNAMFLILYLCVARDMINMIPLGVLAAVLIHIGFKLCAPKKWIRIAAIGREQLFIFASTVLVTLWTDLLIGLLFGTAMKFLVSWALVVQANLRQIHGGSPLHVMARSFRSLFVNPVTWTNDTDGVYNLRFDGPVVCFNSLHVSRELGKIPATATGVRLHFGQNVGLIDHTSNANITRFVEDWKRCHAGKVELLGLGSMRHHSRDHESMRTTKPHAKPLQRLA